MGRGKNISAKGRDTDGPTGEMAQHTGLLEEKPLWLEYHIQTRESQEMGLER